MIDTKQRIIETAERLFGERGYATTSLRQVIAEAEVNVAAVHYHFGTKEDLLDAVVKPRADQVNTERLQMLDRAEADSGGAPLKVETVLEAFLIPTAAVARANPPFVRLMGRMLSEGMMPAIVERHFQPVKERFFAVLSRSLPHLSREELMWRVHFMIGAMAHTMIQEPITPFVIPETDFEVRLRRLGRFLGAAFRAPGEGEEK